MPSKNTKAALKRYGRHYPIPNLKKDLKQMKSGKDLSGPQSKADAVSVYVQVRGM